MADTPAIRGPYSIPIIDSGKNPKLTFNITVLIARKFDNSICKAISKPSWEIFLVLNLNDFFKIYKHLLTIIN